MKGEGEGNKTDMQKKSKKNKPMTAYVCTHGDYAIFFVQQTER